MSDDGAAALDALFWRDEILQALYWLQGEGLADGTDAPSLARLLVADEAIIAQELERLTAGGYLDYVPGPPACFQLTEMGRLEGGRRFADEFEGLTQQAHGECAPGCWCQDPRHAADPCPSRPGVARGA
jgi:hypothetical protein